MRDEIRLRFWDDVYRKWHRLTNFAMESASGSVQTLDSMFPELSMKINSAHTCQIMKMSCQATHAPLATCHIVAVLWFAALITWNQKKWWLSVRVFLSLVNISNSQEWSLSRSIPELRLVRPLTSQKEEFIPSFSTFCPIKCKHQHHHHHNYHQHDQYHHHHYQQNYHHHHNDNQPHQY